MTHLATLTLASALIVSGASMRPVAAQQPAPPTATGTWQREPDLLAARAAHAVVATLSAIYVLGGTGADGRPVLDVERFDGKAWTRETTLPAEGLNAPAAAVVNDTIYLIGGFGTTTNQPLASVRAYNVRTRQWSDAAPLPAPRGGHAAIVFEGRVHVIGGGNAVSTIDDHSVYDPKTNVWSERARLPRRTGSPAVAVFQGRLYSVGGRSGTNDFGDVHIYDAAADAWTPGPAIDPRGTGGAAVLGRSLFYFGGESQPRSAVLGDVLRLDPGAALWAADTPLPTPRNFARAVILNKRVFVVGGSTGYGRGHAAVGSVIVESFLPARGSF